jgi:hypothetical protein
MEEMAKMLEPTQNLKNEYLKLDNISRCKILNLLSKNCELNHVSCSIEWDNPFDLLFNAPKGTKWWS